MIRTIDSYSQLVISLRSMLIDVSELRSELVKNGLSPDGSDLSEQLTTNILTAVGIKNAVIVFYVNESETPDNVSMDEDVSISSYQSYSMHVIVYGLAGQMLAHKIKARFESSSIREQLYRDGIHLVAVSSISDGTEFINDVMWPRKDFDIDVSVRYSISKTSDSSKIESAKLDGVYVDYP